MEDYYRNILRLLHKILHLFLKPVRWRVDTVQYMPAHAIIVPDIDNDIVTVYLRPALHQRGKVLSHKKNTDVSHPIPWRRIESIECLRHRPYICREARKSLRWRLRHSGNTVWSSTFDDGGKGERIDIGKIFQDRGRWPSNQSYRRLLMTRSVC